MMTRGRRESDPDKDDERERKKSFNSLLSFCKDAAVCEEERTPKLDFLESEKSLERFFKSRDETDGRAPVFLSHTLDAQ